MFWVIIEGHITYLKKNIFFNFFALHHWSHNQNTNPLPPPPPKKNHYSTIVIFLYEEFFLLKWHFFNTQAWYPHSPKRRRCYTCFLACTCLQCCKINGCNIVQRIIECKWFSVRPVLKSYFTVAVIQFNQSNWK